MNKNTKNIYNKNLANNSKVEELNNTILEIKIGQIKEKLEEIAFLKDEISSINGTLESADGKNNCGLCPQVAGLVDSTKLLVNQLLGQVEKNKVKIKKLTTEVSKLKKEKDKLIGKNSKLKDKKDELKEKAFKDPLTGLYNRHFMKKVISKNITRSKEDVNYNFSVSLIDLDHFKQINDKYGHDAGDLVLKSFSEFMLSTLKQLEIPVEKDRRKNGKRNIIFRYGGEEFLIISSLSPKKLKIFLNKCLAGFSKVVHRYEGKEFSVTFSAGVAEYKSGGKIIINGDKLIDNTDKALYKAKGRGRNTVEIFNGND